MVLFRFSRLVLAALMAFRRGVLLRSGRESCRAVEWQLSSTGEFKWRDAEPLLPLAALAARI